MPTLSRFIKSLSHPHHHSEPWAYLADHVYRYPTEEDIRPYRKPTLPEIAKGIHTARISRHGQLTADAGGVVLETCDGQKVDTELLPAGAGGLEQLKTALLSNRKRGKLQVFSQGTTAEFRQLLDLWGRWLLWNGYTIHVLGSLQRIVALHVTKSNRSWWLCDAEIVTGIPLRELNAQIAAEAAVTGQIDPYVQLLQQRLCDLQRELTNRFNVSLHPTIGMTAAKAVSWSIPDGVWLWRPSPTYVTMCRLGGGFRGGYVSAVDYDGPAWKIDVRRQYTAALKAEFPYAISFGPWAETGMNSRGLFMCTVRGPGKMRVLLNVWDKHSGRFKLQKWNSAECVAILPTCEIAGLVALGYLVLPGYGFIYNHTFNFKPYVNKLQLLTELHGAESLIGLMCKSLGSKVWGKWAQPPEREQIAYSQERPGEDWAPMTKENGDEIEHLWTAQHVVYQSVQQIGMATIVTAAARAQLYRKAAQLLQQGYKLAALYTDAIIVEGRPPPHPPPTEVSIGKWRYEGWTPAVSVRHTGAHTWGEVAHRPGVAGATVADIQSIGYKEAPPEGEAPLSVARPLSRR